MDYFFCMTYTLQMNMFWQLRDSPKTYATTGKKQIGNVYLLCGMGLAGYHNMCN